MWLRLRLRDWSPNHRTTTPRLGRRRPRCGAAPLCTAPRASTLAIQSHRAVARAFGLAESNSVRAAAALDCPTSRYAPVEACGFLAAACAALVPPHAKSDDDVRRRD